MHFDLVTSVPDLSDELQVTSLWRFFFSRLCLSDSILFKDFIGWIRRDKMPQPQKCTFWEKPES